jgi:hypothetical protein
MRTIAFSLAAAAGLGLAAPAVAEDVQAQDPASVVAAMQQAGYRAVLGTDDVGDPQIRSATGGSDFLIYFYNCTENTDCRTIQFYAGYSEPNSATLETMNEWNENNRFGRAYLGDDGIARIEMDLDLDDGGVSQALFEDNLEYWAIVMSRFEDYVGY